MAYDSYSLMKWLDDVLKASQIVKKKGFKAVTHGGGAHADDTLAAALLWRSGAEAVYRLNTAEEILKIEGDVVLFDIGDQFQLPDRYVVLDHHGVSDPAEEPSSVIQVSLAVGARYAPLVATLIHWVDLFDRYGPEAKRWAGPYGNSLNNGVVKYFGESNGLVRDTKFLDLLADALYSKLSLDLAAFSEAFKLAEKLPFSDLAEKYPRTFQTLRLMQAASKDVITASTSKEAYETGFGIDFGAYAVLAVPELEQYVLKGLERHYADAKRATEIVSSQRYKLITTGEIAAVAVEENVPPAPLWNALIDEKALNGPVLIVVKDRRNPGAYTVWRPDRYANIIDFRKIGGDRVLFKHVTGFMAVVRGESAEEVAAYVLEQLDVV